MALDQLTTEQLRKKFKNNFSLCAFSINVARHMIENGQQVSLKEVLSILAQQKPETE